MNTSGEVNIAVGKINIAGHFPDRLHGEGLAFDYWMAFYICNDLHTVVRKMCVPAGTEECISPRLCRDGPPGDCDARFSRCGRPFSRDDTIFGHRRKTSELSEVHFVVINLPGLSVEASLEIEIDIRIHA